MLEEVDQTKIHTSRKLVHVERGQARVHIIFDDGFEDQVDLLVGADGIRSVSYIHCMLQATLVWFDCAID